MVSQAVVLGSCGAWPEPGRACSGFVVEHAGFRVVMDLGYGTLTRLLTLVDSHVGAGIDAVIITHKHPDHMLDLHGLFRARWFGDHGADPIPLYAPDGVVQRLQGLEEDDDGAILKVFVPLLPLLPLLPLSQRRHLRVVAARQTSCSYR